MGDTENAVPPSKKRVAGRQLSRDNPGIDDEEDAPQQETGTFQRASDEVLATRKIVKVRRHQALTAPSSNPFAGICLVSPSTESNEKPAEVSTEELASIKKAVPEEGVDEKKAADKEPEMTETIRKDENDEQSNQPEAEVVANKENSNPINQATKTERNNGNGGGQETDNVGNKDNGHENLDTEPTGTAAPPLSSFQQLSSNQNAFTGLAGSGFSSSSFSFGSIPEEGSTLGAGSLFVLENDKRSSFPSFGLGNSNNGNTSLFGPVSKNEGSSLPPMREVPLETGEENEKAVFTVDAALFEFIDGGWKERGRGEVKVNISTTKADRARLVMRARGNYRLILNASLFPDMMLTNMEKRGITFACMNSASEGKDGLVTFALKFKDSSVVEEFCEAVTAYKGKKASVLKTPENSPKALDV